MVKGAGKLLNKYGNIMVLALRNKLANDGNDASRRTSNSIKYEVVGSGIEIDYLESLEAISNGLNPRSSVGGGAGDVDPFTANIMDWMRAKNISPLVKKGSLERRMRSSAWLITKAIRQKGTIKNRAYSGTNVLDLIAAESKIMNDFADESVDLLIDSLEF